MKEFSGRLKQAADTLQLTLSDAQQEALLAYLSQLQRWNRTYNLTAIRDPSQMLVQHVFDSMSIVMRLRDATKDHVASGKQVSVLDVGSGAGLPGTIIAILEPDWRVSCVDAVEKKTAFIRQIAGVLGLSNLQALHNRIEMLQEMNATIVTSRAFASLADFADLAGKHVAQDGWLVAMKGRIPDDEISELQKKADWRVERIDPVVVPELDAQRCLIWLKQDQGTL
ncbi:16S rRNA (guanine(527)-N(7))-methyltransferase RsmG [Paracandidimonas soli]|uniref:Ribosomal RNA small subunit methyltransferase G n=1 Tax=Paracandidimonas soli TaxID=1917182 RepID=A0A4R3VF11_9BURK|nr:16S rRNA (guanine(527)-N(7))-methyltransferase RsmG [Paracandidimonas soli]TCV02563.1 16S rRNA m(7)G-527 methyltransferase [Paracandidimonas soli]